MTIAGIQPQIWISIIAILGVAGLSLLVDHLKRKNQQLREAMVELRLRRAQDQRQAPSRAAVAKAAVTDGQKRFVAAAAQAAAVRVAAEKAATEAPAAVAPVKPAKSFEEFIGRSDAVSRNTAEPKIVEPKTADRNSEARDRNLAIREAQDRGVEFASPHGRRRASNPPPENLPRLEDMNPREALAEWLNKRAAARGTQKPMPAVPTAPAAELSRLAAVEAVVPQPVAPIEAPALRQPVVVAQAPVAKPAQKATASSGPAVVIDESLWESLLGSPSASKRVAIPDWTVVPVTSNAAAAATQVRFELIQGAGGIPAGMHELSTLNRLLEANKPFTGLVVSIGVNQTDGSAVSHDVMLNVNHFVRGLLRDGDFACQTGDDEFLILCPEEQAADAQRRIGDISERLWDFQLRGVGSFSVVFGWGDVQVDGEAIGEAVASATERMHQTRRARKTVSFESASPRRKVVAAV